MLGVGEELILDIKCVLGGTVIHLYYPISIRTSGYLSRSQNGISQRDLPWQKIFFQQCQNTDRRTNLERVSKWTHVRVSGQTVQSWILTIIGHWFIARVDNRSRGLH